MRSVHRAKRSDGSIACGQPPGLSAIGPDLIVIFAQQVFKRRPTPARFRDPELEPQRRKNAGDLAEAKLGGPAIFAVRVE